MTPTPAIDPAASVADFPGRDELESLLGSLVPTGWRAALSEGDESELARLRTTLDNPAMVEALRDKGMEVVLG